MLHKVLEVSDSSRLHGRIRLLRAASARDADLGLCADPFLGYPAREPRPRRSSRKQILSLAPGDMHHYARSVGASGPAESHWICRASRRRYRGK